MFTRPKTIPGPNDPPQLPEMHTDEEVGGIFIPGSTAEAFHPQVEPGTSHVSPDAK